MALFLVSAPKDEPITLAEAREHLRRGDITDEDALIDGLRVAAREYIELFTSRKLITQTWDWKFDGFPACSEIELPFAPVASVTSVSYVDTDGATQVWSSSNYTADLPSGPWAAPGRIVLGYQAAWPTTRNVVNAVTVRFVTGYGLTGSTVPPTLKAALKLLLGHLYFNREAVQVGVGLGAVEVPLGVSALLTGFRVR